MKLQTIELDGAVLDWAAAKCKFPDAHTNDIEVWIQPLSCDDPADFAFEPSTNWLQGGPIIQRERITICPNTDSTWWAVHPGAELEVHGATALQAAVRAYVHAKFGDEIEVPDDLLEVA